MKLLVSVRSAEEARAALAGGADIIDVKDPSGGPLGMASLEQIEAIRSIVPASVPLSIACGEVVERELSTPAQLPPIHFAKLGFAGITSATEGARRWHRVRQQLDAACASLPGWIAVIYADSATRPTLSPEAVLELAIASDCVGLLFDTCDKLSGNLWDFLSAQSMQPLVEAAHARGLQVALAGRLGYDDIPAAAALQADIFAVRSAACVMGQRNGAICSESVAKLKARIAETG